MTCFQMILHTQEHQWKAKTDYNLQILDIVNTEKVTPDQKFYDFVLYFS